MPDAGTVFGRAAIAVARRDPYAGRVDSVEGGQLIGRHPTRVAPRVQRTRLTQRHHQGPVAPQVQHEHPFAQQQLRQCAPVEIGPFLGAHLFHPVARPGRHAHGRIVDLPYLLR